MHVIQRYAPSMRLLHWLRAILIIGLIGLGWTMTFLPETDLERFTWMYPVHKEFGVLAFIVGIVAIAVRLRSVLPGHPSGLKVWETTLSRITQWAMLSLAVVVPLMGYCMSSSFSQSDGVPFFFFDLPELLAKNDAAFAVFAWLHKVLAYTLLGLIVLHVAAVIKHRFFDHGRDTDVLKQML